MARARGWIHELAQGWTDWEDLRYLLRLHAVRRPRHSTLFWVSAHSVQDCIHALAGTETAATGSSRGKGNE
ncbi:hypothetical protein [Archangium sp.]|uniref:hypothetical protein n=1 Tax=Archangium sp. TaxID=1872627 RepID=UPI002D43C59A|nr:hypothetical protein [Archangium sp.]HYO56789.1 hypothetical protein [Archangium sp.]